MKKQMNKTAAAAMSKVDKNYQEQKELIELSAPFMDIPGYKHNFRSGKKVYVCFNADSAETLASILNMVKPTNETFENTYAGKDSTEIGAAYRITAQSSFYHTEELKIQYEHNKVSIWIKADISLIADFVSEYVRKVTSSEYHYFTGYSNRQLQDATLRAYSFGTGHESRYYGGDNVLVNPDTINEIANNWKAGNGGLFRK